MLKKMDRWKLRDPLGGKRKTDAAEKSPRHFGAAALTAVVVGTLALSGSAPAHADTVYEIVGEWQAGTPDPVKQGDDVVSVWRFNINDDAPAPSNDPVDNVTVTFTAQHGVFTALPDLCLVEAADPAVPLTPVSEIQNDGKTLVCNLGIRDQGAAELMLTGLQVTGATGDKVSVSGAIGGETATLPELSIVNPFAMDMKFDGGSDSSRGTGTEHFVRFPWSLRHGPGGEAGPSSVVYTLSFTNTAGNDLRVDTPACGPIRSNLAGHPFSDLTHAADETAPFPGTCTVVRTSANTFKLTISGIDYSKTQVPTLDTGGNPLEDGWDVVAAGEIQLALTYVQNGQVRFTATETTYVADESDATSTGNLDNNKNAVSVLRGNYNGGWNLRLVGLPGAMWQNTSLAAPGDTVRAAASVRPPTTNTPGGRTASCNVLDTRYVEFVQVQPGRVNPDGDGTVLPYAGSGGIQYAYYVGNGPLPTPAGDGGGILNPNSSNYNPNNFSCDSRFDSANWVSTPPADLSKVKAIQTVIPLSAAPGIYAGDSSGIARIYIDSKVKPGVAAGQDIWTWASWNIGDGWGEPDRSMNAGNVPVEGVKTPGLRYPFTGQGRDVLRVVTAKPVVEKEVDQAVTLPGATVQYTVKYSAQASSDFNVPEYVLTDELPAGTEYVAGSASPAPTSVSGQTLTWKFTNFPTNTDRVLTYSVRLSDDAVPGDTFKNTVTAKVADQTNQASATVKIRDGGFVQLNKIAAADKVPHASGVAANSWTVRLTSHDTTKSSFTDTIDVLPYNGDGRGTNFAGTYKLSAAVQAVAGATVYYTTADPATLVDDPADPSNGAPNAPSGIWSTTFVENATGVRVIGPELKPSQQQEFTISVITADATYEDRYVNRAESRAERQELKMRTSSSFEIGAVNSVTIKKYVQDDAGDWHDAQDIDDYPTYFAGDTVPYRLVVTNTGDQTLNNVTITDDKIDLSALTPLPNGLAAGAVIPELLPGSANEVTIEYSMVLGDEALGGSLVNSACAVPEDAEVDDSCDPAGIFVESSTLAWEKVNAGAVQERLAGSEWSLVRVDAGGAPIGSAIVVTDCIEDDVADCSDADKDPAAGQFLITGLVAGDYTLTETRAPAGYVLDATVREITVRGDSSFAAPIENEQSTVPSLPLTGGLGTLGIFLGAGGLGALVIFGLALQRRRAATSRI